MINGRCIEVDIGSLGTVRFSPWNRYSVYTGNQMESDQRVVFMDRQDYREAS